MKRPAFILLVIACALFAFASGAFAATNIVSSPSTSHWAWNDVIGWIDFLSPNTANVTDSGLNGYATSSSGAVSFDCATSPAGNICNSTVNYQVKNDGSGALGGWAWNDVIGWISFCGRPGGGSNCQDTNSTYEVQVSATTGDFSGWAWNDVIGWISFNCLDVGGQSFCDNTSSYKVDTTWTATSTLGYLDSSTFDTGIVGGAQINSVLWHGSKPSPANGSFVGFQFAVSNDSSGPWNYEGPDGTAATYYGTSASPGASIPVSYTLHNNARYFRYRIFLSSTVTHSASPRVDDISVNWSR